MTTTCPWSSPALDSYTCDTNLDFPHSFIAVLDMADDKLYVTSNQFLNGGSGVHQKSSSSTSSKTMEPGTRYGGPLLASNGSVAQKKNAIDNGLKVSTYIVNE